MELRQLVTDHERQMFAKNLAEARATRGVGFKETSISAMPHHGGTETRSLYWFLRASVSPWFLLHSQFATDVVSDARHVGRYNRYDPGLFQRLQRERHLLVSAVEVVFDDGGQ